MTKPDGSSNASTGKLSGEAWVKSLSHEEKTVLAHWQTGGSSKIREGLLKNTLDPEVRAKIDAVNSALNKSAPYEGECWRGMHDMDDFTFSQLAKSDVIEWETFYSSSKSDRSAAKFLICKNRNLKSLMFRITNKTGVDISPASVREKSHEQEILLRPGTQYRVVGRTTKTFTYVEANKVDNELRLTENTIETLELSLEEI